MKKLICKKHKKFNGHCLACIIAKIENKGRVIK